MNNQPFFTIGIPVYNTSKWVGDCIDSILSQGFEDFEIICVDDGSTDNSLDVLNSYAAKDSRIKVITRENGGVSRARNTIFYNAQGKYIYILDSDDVMCADILTNAYTELNENNFPDIMHTGCIRIFNGVESNADWPYPGDEYFDPSLTKDERLIKLWLSAKLSVYSATKFINKDFLHRYGISFSPRYMAFEDSDFSFDVYRKADTIVFSNIRSFIYYLPREGSVSTDFSPAYLKSVLIRWTDFYDSYYKWNLSEEYLEKVKESETEFYYHYQSEAIGRIKKGVSKQEIIDVACVVEDVLGTKLRKMPLPKGRNRLIFLLNRIIGPQKTYSAFYTYLKLRGIV